TKTPIFRSDWLPFWDVAAETGLPVHVHIGGGTHSLAPAPGSWQHPAVVSAGALQVDELISGVVFSGILETRPSVKAIFGECGFGWVPFLVERMDKMFHQYNHRSQDIRLTMMPSEIFRRQVRVTFEDEDIAVPLIPALGAETVMWASDYP